MAAFAPCDHVGELMAIDPEQASHRLKIALLRRRDNAVRQCSNNQSLKVGLMEQTYCVPVEPEGGGKRHEGLAFALIDVSILEHSFKQA